MIGGVVLLLCFFILVPFFGTSQTVEQARFSASGGFYEESFSLELSPLNQQHHIRFTTNGNCPTAQSRLYTGPLWLDGSLFSDADIYTINLTPENVTFMPDSVRHCIVIRAAVFDENDSCVSEITTNSYFIHALGCDTHGLPAVSLCSDAYGLFDDEQGILVPGASFNPQFPNTTGNYYQTGLEWERLVNVEYYENGQGYINQLAGLRVHGLKSRRFQQKALKLYARDTYGENRFRHRFFESIPNDSFKHLALKPFSSSWNNTGINDYLANSIVSHLNVESLASRPVVLFLNGEYWGIYFLHEKPDERYLEDHFGMEPELVTVLNGWEPGVDCGNPMYYKALFRWMSDADLTDPEAYAYAASKIDMDNFIDYYIFELFSENTDWPNNNMRCWQYGDTPLRWIFFDGDACLCWMTFNAFEHAVYVGDASWPSSTKATLFFRKLFVNESFKQQFKQRFDELMNSVFRYENLNPLFEDIKATLAPEVPFQSERFGFPDSVETWNTYLGHTHWFLLKRCEYLVPKLGEFMHWSVPEQCSADLQIYPNPFIDQVTLSLESEMDRTGVCVVYDMMGRQVFSQQVSLHQGPNTVSLNLSLAPGIYFLKTDGVVIKIVRQ